MSKEEAEARIENALNMLIECGGIDGSHHKMWTIDQAIRALTGGEKIVKTFDHGGTFTEYGESEEYKQIVLESCDGEDGPDTYEWDTGIAP